MTPNDIPKCKYGPFRKHTYAMCGHSTCNDLTEQMGPRNNTEAFRQSLKTNSLIKFVNESTLVIQV